MSKYESVFIIRTPYQYLNALEAIDRYGVEVEYAVLIIWSNHFKKRFRHIIENEKWGKVKYMPVVHHGKNVSWSEKIKIISEDLKYLIRTSLISIELGSVKNCFTIAPVEKYLQHIINKLSCDELVIIDEGVGVFDMTRRYFRKRKKDLKRGFIGYDRRRERNCEFFTSYPLEEHVEGLEGCEIKRHSFGALKSRNKIEKCKYEGGIILGTERNEKTKSIYRKFIYKSIKFMKECTNKIWYKPHRMETNYQIKEIISNNNVSLIGNNLPVEIALPKRKIIPKIVSGFASTAIHSILKIYESKVSKIRVFGSKKGSHKGRMAYNYYESLPNDEVEVVYL